MRPNIRPPFTAVFAVIASSALVLSACSTDDNADNAATTETASTTATQTATPTQNRDEVVPVADNDSPAAKHLPPNFDLQSHRGGRGEWTEESATAFEESLGLGVTTLEFDIVMSADGVPVVWHDPEIQAEKCRDTEPVDSEDPAFPYVGKLVHELDWAQLQTLTCDVKLEEDFPDQKPVEGNKLLQLADVFTLAENHPDVYFNIETKIEAEEREKSAEPEEFVDAIVAAADEAGVTDRIMIQSFDWRSLPLVREKNPEIPLVMLYDDTTWTPDSDWTGEIDYAEVDGDIVAAAEQLGAEVLSPGYAEPSDAEAGDDDYNPTATREYINKAHEAGIRVVPWTVNDEATMREQLDAGVDGIITDYPTLLASILQERNIDYSG